MTQTKLHRDATPGIPKRLRKLLQEFLRKILNISARGERPSDGAAAEARCDVARCRLCIYIYVDLEFAFLDINIVPMRILNGKYMNTYIYILNMSEKQLQALRHELSDQDPFFHSSEPVPCMSTPLQAPDICGWSLSKLFCSYQAFS